MRRNAALCEGLAATSHDRPTWGPGKYCPPGTRTFRIGGTRPPISPSPGDQAAAWRIAAGFRELREDDFAGGFVIRRLKPFGSAEVRTWWTASICRLVTAHPDAPGDQPPPDLDLMPFIRLIGSLGLEFLTADLARRADRTWQLIELGDGQVSDRPSTTSPATLIAAALAR